MYFYKYNGKSHTKIWGSKLLETGSSPSKHLYYTKEYWERKSQDCNVAAIDIWNAYYMHAYIYFWQYHSIDLIIFIMIWTICCTYLFYALSHIHSMFLIIIDNLWYALNFISLFFLLSIMHNKYKYMCILYITQCT